MFLSNPCLNNRAIVEVATFYIVFIFDFRRCKDRQNSRSKDKNIPPNTAWYMEVY